MTDRESRAVELLKRLSAAWDDETADDLIAAFKDAHAFLSAPPEPDETVWADGWARFYGLSNGAAWGVQVLMLPERTEGLFHVRIPVPAHLLKPEPIVGEIVEPGEKGQR